MLVLSRKPSESIVIGDNIVIQILDSRNGQMRIGITAPLDISIHRSEIYTRIHGKMPPILEENLKEEETA